MFVYRIPVGPFSVALAPQSDTAMYAFFPDSRELINHLAAIHTVWTPVDCKCEYSLKVA